MKIKFIGMCAFTPAKHDGKAGYTVVMPLGHGDHKPTLTLAIQDGDDPLDLTQTSWLPDVVDVTEFVDPLDATTVRLQTARWDLTGLTVAQVGKADAVTWGANKSKLFDFAASGRHKNPKTRAMADILKSSGRCALFHVSEGELSVRDADVADFDVYKEPRTIGDLPSESAIEVAQAVELKTSYVQITYSEHRVITFKGTADTPLLTISNLAPVIGGGAAHFHHYYEVVERAAGEKRLQLEAAIPPYFDCVPPTGTP